ncbi:hypothetical protein CMI37_16675 [Candidatus Pacearchaeota archaeon]|jgi:hypothetical protein|nr:hypothetical protein [Candidatus Pacearchaeota archaeon]|tara:strand:- start:499 stop:1593 length:1095 start_codon:yes stop_codon:yes gene_type:complete
MAKKKAKKWLFDFTINREVEKERTTSSKNKEGKEVQTTEKYDETVPVKFFLKKPNRKLYDEAELFYGVKMSEGIKAGLLTRNLLAKRYEDDGGAFSETEKERYGQLYMDLYNKENEYQKLQLNLDNKSQDLKAGIEQDLLLEISDIRRELTDIENSQSNIFDQTAENRAKNQTIMWWVLSLAHWQEYEHNEANPFFGAGTYDEKLDQYDLFEDSDEEFHVEAIRKLAYFVSFWYMGRATSEEEFKSIEELYTSQSQYDEDEEPENSDAEEAPEEVSEEASEEAAKEVLEKATADKKEKAAAKPKKKRGRKPKAKVVEKEAVEDKKEIVAEETPQENAEEAQKTTAEVITAETKTSVSSENEEQK